MGLVRMGWRAFAATLVLMMFGLAPSRAIAAPEVSVGIVVIEASKQGKDVDKRVRALKLDKRLEVYGFTSAKVRDELTAKVALGSSVSLEFKGSKGKKTRMLKVKVLEAKKSMVKLEVAVPDIRFETTTQHKDSGTIMLALPAGQSGRLFLAVSPKL